MITCQCPKCAESFEAEEEWIGMDAECPFCQQTIKIEKIGSPKIKLKPEVSSQSEPKAEPEPKKFILNDGDDLLKTIRSVLEAHQEPKDLLFVGEAIPIDKLNNFIANFNVGKSTVFGLIGLKGNCKEGIGFGEKGVYVKSNLFHKFISYDDFRTMSITEKNKDHIIFHTSEINYESGFLPSPVKSERLMKILGDIQKLLNGEEISVMPYVPPPPLTPEEKKKNDREGCLGLSGCLIAIVAVIGLIIWGISSCSSTGDIYERAHELCKQGECKKAVALACERYWKDGKDKQKCWIHQAKNCPMDGGDGWDLLVSESGFVTNLEAIIIGSGFTFDKKYTTKDIAEMSGKQLKTVRQKIKERKESMGMKEHDFSSRFVRDDCTCLEEIIIHCAKKAK